MQLKEIAAPTEYIMERVIELCDKQADEPLTEDEIEKLADLSYELAEYRVPDLIQRNNELEAHIDHLDSRDERRYR
ncbi:hypothetical protein FE326_07010 [Dolosigranulum pigrum]|uniref:hypothetical protein n=1 Tax=Dolosigranulum pigrum TaxID=29394 RepID=UPI001AD89009|nr:hypothetical protein [Dolosigranulum pigrum]QTJ41930.1 hypothetical protein FE326_07010 [Dolosigranulum pigrum]